MFTKKILDTIPDFDDRFFVNCLDTALRYHTLRYKLATLKVCKSAGPDNLFPRVLKELATELCVPLSKIFSKSLDEGKLPEVPVEKGKYNPMQYTRKEIELPLLTIVC